MKRVWVLGAGGMLGTALVRALSAPGAALYRFPQSLAWSDRTQLSLQLGQGLKAFLSGLTADDDWEIYWAAGVGAMGSSADELDAETQALAALLDQLQASLPSCPAPGVIAFASSAGALYAGSPQFEITEQTPITLLNPYAQAKRRQEQLLEAALPALAQVRVLIARFSTLYGPGQAQGKRQGLLTHIARCALRHQPVEIFVPLDTARDYLFVDDAAGALVASARALARWPERLHTRIIAAERSATISEILSTFNRLIKRRLRVVCNRNSLSALYAPRVAYRSLSPLAHEGDLPQHTLLEGAAALLRAERLAYVARLNKV